MGFKTCLVYCRIGMIDDGIRNCRQILQTFIVVFMNLNNLLNPSKKTSQSTRMYSFYQFNND